MTSWVPTESHTSLTLGTLLLALVGCAGEQAQAQVPVTATQTRRLPARTAHGEISIGLGAVGIAKPNAMGDKGLQRQVAIANARTTLAWELKVRVENLFNHLNPRAAISSAPIGDQPIDPMVMKRAIKNVTRQVVDLTLEDTETRGIWINPKDGSLHVFVAMTKASLDHALTSAAKAQIKREIAHGAQGLGTALDRLDAAVAASADPVP